MAEEGGGGGNGVIAELSILLGLKVNKKEAEEGDSLMEHLKKSLEYFAGFEAVKGLFELVEHTTEAAVANKHLAEKLGISIESVQELSYAADVTGASVEDMRVSLQHLAFGMQTASKTGTGPLVDGLQRLHIPLSNLKKESLDADLEEIAEAFKNAGPEVNKTALAIELFGRKGTVLIPLLNKGKDGIKELRAEFREIGSETTAEQAEALEKLEEDQKKIKYLWEGIKSDVVMALLPALKELVEHFFEWVKANRELIATSLISLVNALTLAMRGLGFVIGVVAKAFNFIAQDGDAVAAILYTIGGAIAYVAGKALLAYLEGQFTWGMWITLISLVVYGVIKLVEWVETLSGPMQALLAVATALGIVLAVSMIPGLATMVIVTWDLVAASIAFAAANFWWIWIPAAIGAVIALVYELIENFDEVRDTAIDIANTIGDFFSSIGSTIKKAITDAFDWVENKWKEFKSNHPWIAKGLEVGKDAISAPFQLLTSNPVGDSMSQYLEGEKPSIKGNDGVSAPASISIEQNIHPTPGMSEQDVADLVKDGTKDVLDNWVRENHAGAGLS